MLVTLLKYDNEQIAAGAARVCTESATINDIFNDLGNNTEADLALLTRVMDQGHLSVAEHVSFTFGIEGISRACSHQLVRHRLASYAQQSQRYVAETSQESVVPPTIDYDEDLFNEYMEHMDSCYTLYEHFLDQGVPAEDARFVLPNAACTALVMTMNARELMLFCAMRRCSSAQWEIKELADKIHKEVAKVAPVLAKYMVPKCELVGYCTESKKKCCGLRPHRSKFFSESKVS